MVEEDSKQGSLLDKGSKTEKDASHDMNAEDLSVISLKNTNVSCSDDAEENFQSHNERAKSKSSKQGPPKYRSQRYILAYIIFGGLMNIFFQRSCFSIAIVCMVNHTAVSPFSAIYINNSKSPNMNDSVHRFSSSAKNVSKVDTLPIFVNSSHNEVVHDNGNSADLSQTIHGASNVDEDGRSRNANGEDESCNSQLLQSKDENEDGPLVWDKTTQGILLGAVYWTFMSFSVPSNFLVQRYRKKRLVIMSMGLMIVTTLSTHGASLLSPWLVFFIKLVQGACTALAILALYGMWAKWAPPQERASLMSLSFSGMTFGNAVVFPLSALLCKYGFLGGWPSVFYVFAFICLVWLFFMWLLTEESPSEHSWISPEERDFIVCSISNSTRTEKLKVPWRPLVKSPAVWAIILGQTSFTWALFLFMSTLPLYMYEILKMDIKSNGLFTMFPYVAFLISAQVAGQISDFLISRRLMSVLWVRRMCNIISGVIPAALVIPISFLNCSQASLAVALLTLTIGATGFAFSYILVNPYDIAPSYAGSIIAVSNTIATIPGIVTPYFVTAMTKDKTREQWQIVFFVTAGILVIGSIGFCTMCSSHILPWAKEKEIGSLVPCENENSSRDPANALYNKNKREEEI